MSYRDRSLLDDMATNARVAIEAVAKLDAREFEQTTIPRYTALYAIQIIGEAARHVSNETKARLPDLPWEQIVATRNIIVHGYRAIDPEIIVNIVRDHLPALLAAVETLLQDEPDE